MMRNYWLDRIEERTALGPGALVQHIGTQELMMVEGEYECGYWHCSFPNNGWREYRICATPELRFIARFLD